MMRKNLTKTLSGILKSAIGMNNQSFFRSALVPGSPERCRNQIVSQPLLHAPSNNSTRIDIKEHSQIQPPFSCRDIGDIRRPDSIGNTYSKLLLQKVRSGFLSTGNGRYPKNLTLNRLHLCFTHQPSYTVSTARISQTSQGMKNPRTPVSFIALFKELTNYLSQLSIFSNTCRLPALSPRIIPTPSNPRYFAHLLDRVFPVVLGYESVYRSGSVEKMATAFFKISRSRRRRSFSACKSFKALSEGIAEYSTFCSSWACHTQSLSKPGVIPNDFSTERRVRPSSTTRRTASFLNSSEYFRFAIRHTPSPVKYRNCCVSTKSGED
jgi:hypothetical protein